jgi:hypothetical protein
MKEEVIKNNFGMAFVDMSRELDFITLSIDDYDVLAILPLTKADALKLANAISEVAKNLVA